MSHPRPARKRRRGRLARLYRYAYLKLIRENDSPARIGRGAGLGIFIGIFPTLWFGPLIALAVAGPLGANRAAALVSMAATGPLMPFLWTGAVLVGNALVSAERRIAPALIEQQDTAAVFANFLGTFLLGAVVVGAALALAGYGLAWWLASKLRHRKNHQTNSAATPGNLA